MSMIILTLPPLDLLQQALDTPRGKGGGGGHGHGSDFDKLVSAQINNQPVANPQAVAPRPRVVASELKPKKDDRRDHRDDQAEEEGNEQPEEQARRQASGRSLWA